MGNLRLKSDHRLLCGDSTNQADVSRLMNGERAALCLTDPPYSVNYDKSHEKRGGDATVHSAYIESDVKPVDLLDFMGLVPANVMVWTYPIDRHFQALASAYQRHGWEFRKELVWVKDSFSFWMSAKYQQKHEPIMWAVRKGCSLGGDIPSNATTVLEYPRPKAHDLHPTAKPIDLWHLLIKHHASRGDVVYEPFCGSGTTVVVAEMEGCRCMGIERSPQYCDVIVNRYKTLFGKDAITDGKAANKK